MGFLAATAEMFLRFVFGVIFSTSGWSKVRLGAARWLALGAVEGAVGLAVLTGFALKWVTPVLLLLLAVFTVYLYRAWRRQVRKKCGCGGVLGDAMIGQAILLRNGILGLGAGALLALVAGGGRAAGVDLLLRQGVPAFPFETWAGSAAGLLLGGAAFGLWLRFRPTGDRPLPSDGPAA